MKHRAECGVRTGHLAQSRTNYARLDCMHGSQQ